MTASSTSKARSPLATKSNKQNVPISSKPAKQLRRKPSSHHLIDSSESDPSAHSSIFEALYFSANSSDSSNNRTEHWPMVSLKRGHIERSSIRPILTNENAPGEMTAMEFATRTIEDLLGSTPILYGKGTALETIIEQKSHSTITRTKSLDDLHPSLHQKSMDLAYSLNSKASFSVDDLSLIKSSYHEALTAIEKIPHTLRCPQNLYAGPKKPILPPPDRPSTPPGMPSWTEAQAEAVRRNRRREFRLRAVSAPQQQNRFIRWISQEIAGIPTPSLDHHRAHGPQIHRFRTPRGAHGDIHNHPFHHAPIAQVKPLTAQSHIVPDAGTSNQHNIAESSQGAQVPRVRHAWSADLSSTGNALAILQRPHLPEKCDHIDHTQSSPLPAAAVESGYTPISPGSPMRNNVETGNTVRGKYWGVGKKVCWRCRLKFADAMVKYCLQKSLAFCCYIFCGVEWDEAEQMIVR